MIFTSFEYAAFLVLVLAGHWAMPVRWRPPWLLAASFAFYATYSRSAVVILACVSVTAWAAALFIPRFTGHGRTALTGAAVVLSASSLVVFKAVEATGLSQDRAELTARFVVPVGLSFFSFQAISYLVDVHRDELAPHRSLVDVALFLSFFPHLLAGPIVRAKRLIPAFHTTRRMPDPVQWAEAAELVLVGVFKKVALADPIIALSLEGVREPGAMGPVHAVVLLPALLLAGYFDITGYVDIARGSAKFLGIDMQRNSLLPLTKATGYADFWRRWQLTLMMWFRDYVYRPLRGGGGTMAGRRGGRWRDDVALFGTFFALGVWHGFTPGWALWGVVSGVIIIAERTRQSRRAVARRAQTRRARRARSRALLPKAPSSAGRLAGALLLVMVTFPLVATESLADSLRMYGALGRFGGTMPSADLVWLTALAVVALIAVDRREQRREATAGSPDPVGVRRAVAFGAMVLAVLVFSGPAPQTFVYFAF